MELKKFAELNRLKGYRLDECDDPEIVGRFGHLFEWGASRFGVCLEGAGTGALENRKKLGLRAGMTLWLECDFGESVLLFDPSDREMSKVAAKIAGVRLRKRVSTAQIEALNRGREQFGFQAGRGSARKGEVRIPLLRVRDSHNQDHEQGTA